MMEKEKRLIDADALTDKVDESKYNNPHPQGMVRVNHRNEHDHFLRMIVDAPTVDAVEVVRCKDCKHWHEETGWCDHHSWFIEEDGEPCHPWESNNWKMLMEDDFCSYGERKDNA